MRATSNDCDPTDFTTLVDALATPDTELPAAIIIRKQTNVKSEKKKKQAKYFTC